MRLLVVLMVLPLIAGCVSMQPPVERIPFPGGEYDSLRESGTAVIRGQAFLKTRGGDVKTAAGEEVVLNPVTSYSQQWYQVAYLNGRPLTGPDPRYLRYIRKTIADADGRFTFRNVAGGDYFIVARVVWEAPTGYGLVPQGGFVAKKVSVEDGTELDVIVTR